MSFDPDSGNETQDIQLFNLFSQMVDELRMIKEILMEISDTQLNYEDVREPNQ